jgi:hypothetical protein
LAFFRYSVVMAVLGGCGWVGLMLCLTMGPG